MKKTTLIILLFIAFSLNSYAQCIVAYENAPHSASNLGLLEPIAPGFITYTGDFHPLSNLIIGNDYEFTCIQNSNSTHKYITITDSSNNVIAHGSSPLTVTGITNSEVRLHYTDDAACNESFVAHTVTLQCISPTCTYTAITNDDCIDAIDLDSYFNTDDTCTTTYVGHNVDATNSSGEVAPSTECADNDSTPSDIWFSLTVPSNGEFSYDHIATPGITALVEVYTGICGSLTPLAPVHCNALLAEVDFTGLTPGATVYLRYWDYDSDDVGNVSFCLKDKSSLSITEHTRQNISIYPNPVKGKLNINSKNEVIQDITIYNILGQKVLNTIPLANQNLIDIEHLTNGAYFVSITINNTSETFKIIKN